MKCGKCLQKKENSDFHSNKRRKTGLAWQCKECAKQSSKQHYKKNKRAILEKKKAWRRANPQEEKAKRDSRADYRKEYYSRFHDARPNYAAASSSVYAAKRLGLETISIVEMEQAMDELSLVFVDCGVCGTSESLEWDHIVPLARGGANTKDNLQRLCKRHNQEKYTDIIDTRKARH